MSSSFDLEPDRFLPGTVGPPGQRVFYLQAVEGTHVVSLRLEKQQVAALAEYLAGILHDLPNFDWPEPDDATLAQPVVPEWVVGALAVAYQEDEDRVVVVAEELVPDDEGEDEGPATPGDIPGDIPGLADGPPPATARFRLTRPQVAMFIRHGAHLVMAGRPLCPICGLPMNPDGHNCPRSNGHGRG